MPAEEEQPENLQSKRHVKQRGKCETKGTSTIVTVGETTTVYDLPHSYYYYLMTFTYPYFCFQIEKEDT